MVFLEGIFYSAWGSNRICIGRYNIVRPSGTLRAMLSFKFQRLKPLARKSVVPMGLINDFVG